MFLRLDEGRAASRLKDRLRAGMAARDIVALGLDALHPTARAMFVDADPFTSYPSQLNWPVRTNEGARAGFLTHCYFPHPMLTVPRGEVRYTGTMDYEYSLRVAQDDARIRLIRSSDDFLVCKMSPATYGMEAVTGGTAALGDLARFAVSNTNRRHKLYMDQPIRFVAGGGTAEWEEAEAQSTRFVEAIYKGVELILANARTDARTMVFLKSFLGPIEDYVSPQIAARLRGWM
jgi:hypothetical protein